MSQRSLDFGAKRFAVQVGKFLHAARPAQVGRDPLADQVSGARRNAGHTATVDHPGGGEWANVASNWLRWQFKGDKEAGKMFAGKDCGLCTNPNWVTSSKKL